YTVFPAIVPSKSPIGMIGFPAVSPNVAAGGTGVWYLSSSNSYVSVSSLTASATAVGPLNPSARLEMSVLPPNFRGRLRTQSPMVYPDPNPAMTGVDGGSIGILVSYPV